MSNSIWFITGSSRGLGRALATAVLAAGHRLVATARNTADLQFLVDDYGDRVRAVALDVARPAEAHGAIAAAVAAFGRIDVVVNNAGYANVSSVEDVAEDDFRAQIETNFFGVVNVTRAVLPVMRAQGAGRIIQISSIGGRHGGPGLGAYQSAKWAVGGFSEVVAAEVAPLGIRVTIVEPGGMKTDWAGSSMRIDPVTAPYQPTVGAFWNARHLTPDAARGEPAKAAAAILTLAELPDPPLHLLLGSDALFLAGIVSQSRAAEDAKWRALSASIDADGLGDFADTPVARMLVSSKRS
jgi:NAD(P)-dependent dehydrogenase (short-subunit alcohol dehydrogenase family)